jgi:hypothetical protein
VGGDPAADGPFGDAQEGGDILLGPALADPLHRQAAALFQIGGGALASHTDGIQSQQLTDQTIATFGSIPDGRRLRLEVVRVGGRWLTSAPAILRFIDRQTPNLNTDPDPAPRTPRRRERAAARAGRELETAHGIR